MLTAGSSYVLTAPAAAYLEAVETGKSEEPAYKATEHYWGMIVDVEKCIGCGLA